jgi:hypothetical protein
VQVLNTCAVPYETVNILEDEALRSGALRCAARDLPRAAPELLRLRCAGMKEYSSWPTFPQLYVGGEFFGGCAAQRVSARVVCARANSRANRCDITVAAFQDGSLKEARQQLACVAFACSALTPPRTPQTLDIASAS